jgi:DNA-binding transcriptional regulator YiaG
MKNKEKMTIKEMRRAVEENTGEKYSQQKFADLTGVPVTNIQRWEQNIVSPPDYARDLIERVLRDEGYLK